MLFEQRINIAVNCVASIESKGLAKSNKAQIVLK